MPVTAELQGGGAAKHAWREGRRWPAWLLATTAIVTALRAVYATLFELAPQEAYYWQYARHLDLSYFDHPPLSAWLIALSVRVLGSTELGVRVPAILAGGVLTLLVYRLGEQVSSPRAGALAALLANATVLFGLGAVIITPDVPLVLCWTAALVVLCDAVLPDGPGPGAAHWRWYAMGALCGLALLSKYTAALLPLQILATALVLPRGRAALRTPHPYLAVLVALAVFSPVIIWNARHEWASFGFQTRGRVSDSDGAHAFLAVRYVGLQLLAVGPLTWATLLASLVWLARRWREPRARVLLLASAPGVALFTVMSPWIFVKMNWVAPAYVGLLAATAAWWSEGWQVRRVRRWAGAVIAVGVLLTGVAHALPVVPALPFPSRDDLTNGWRELAQSVDRERVRPDAHGEPLVIAWGYKPASELAFYMRGQPQTQSDSALAAPGLAYDQWLPSELHHHDAIIVIDARRQPWDTDARIARHCATVEPLPPVTVHRGARPVTTFRMWRCEGWTAGLASSARRTNTSPRSTVARR
ncbi:MAG TPA: glycosyltransferase family 39 protein [Anaeromyxobacteraceae bacterium]|nr:glycosyltransferase family 39 protein [Anaeromyxobacteraceae bacterium]